MNGDSTLGDALERAEHLRLERRYNEALDALELATSRVHDATVDELRRVFLMRLELVCHLRWAPGVDLIAANSKSLSFEQQLVELLQHSAVPALDEAKSWTRLGEAAFSYDRLEHAVRYYGRAKDLIVRLESASSVVLLEILGPLTDSLYRLGRLNEAAESAAEYYRLCCGTAAATPWPLLVAANSLTLVLHDLGRHEESRPILAHAISVAMKHDIEHEDLRELVRRVDDACNDPVPNDPSDDPVPGGAQNQVD